MISIRRTARISIRGVLPSLFELKRETLHRDGGERDRRHALKVIRKYRKPNQRVFVGVTAPIDPHMRLGKKVRTVCLKACEYIR